PPAYSRTFVSKDDVIDFTPQLRQQALDNLSKYRWEQSPFVPPAVLPVSGGKWRGSINIGNTGGGVNWPGSGFDPETGIFYTQASNSGVSSAGFGGEEFEFIRVENQKNRLPRWEADPHYGERGTNQPGSAGIQPAPQAAAPSAADGRGAAGGRGGGGRGGRGAEPGAAPGGGGGGGGRGGLTAGLDGLSIVKPPYGVISAIDLNTGALKFQVPHGDTPDAVRNHPLLRGLNIPK